MIYVSIFELSPLSYKQNLSIHLILKGKFDGMCFYKLGLNVSLQRIFRKDMEIFNQIFQLLLSTLVSIVTRYIFTHMVFFW